MVIIGLDVHGTLSHLTAVNEETGEVIIEMQVESTAESLRRVVSGIKGEKKVIFEEGPLSGLIKDALRDLAQVVSCDPTRNALIARAEDANDERDARRLVTLEMAGALNEVYVPEEPYRTLRSLTNHEYNLVGAVTGYQSRIKAFCRRNGIRYKGKGIYSKNGREQVLDAITNKALLFQAESLYRQFDHVREERVKTRKAVKTLSREIPVIKRIKTIHGLKDGTAPVLVAWIADPFRFKSRKALQSYAGLGIGQGYTNWKPVGRSYASKRGQKRLKRILFIAAWAAVKRKNSMLKKRYEAHLAMGWDYHAAIRDIAKLILHIACSLWKKGTVYKDELVKAPKVKT